MAKKEKSLMRTSKPAVSQSEYSNFIAHLKTKIRSSQFKATISVNREMIRLYWDIGKDLLEKQQQDNWGAGILEKVARDIQNEFPGVEGFSRSNLFRMKAFYLAYKKVAQAVRQSEELPIFSIPWGHNIAIFQQLKTEPAKFALQKLVNIFKN